MYRLVCKLFGNRAASRPLSRCRRSELRLEALEDRCVPAVLFVDPTNVDKGGAFTTITAAVNAAHPGDLIKVVPGTYHESVDVNKAGVTLLGGQVRIPALEAPGPSIITSGVTGFTLDAANVGVQGFTITQEGDAIRTNGSFSGYRILSNTFLDDGVGVHLNTALTGATTTRIAGNKFTSDGGGAVTHDAILVDGAASVANVVVSNNYFISGQELDSSITIDGQHVSTNVQILSNHFEVDAGMVLDNLAGARIDGNYIANPTSTAIELAGGVSNSEVARNTILHSQGTSPAGIVLDEGLVTAVDTGNAISGNNIRGMSAGIELQPASHTTIAGNTIAFSTSDGIVLQGENVGNTVVPCTGNTLSGNTILGNGGDGIRLNLTVRGDVNTLAHNGVSHNQAHGIVVSATGTTLTGNIAKFNGGAGILVSSGHNVLTSNTLAFNLNGAVIDSSFNTLTGNVAEHNSHHGFNLDGASDNLLTSNTARNNLLDGFFAVDGSDFNGFDKNVAVNNGQNGFEIIGDLQNDINSLTSNIANHNGVDGIRVADGNHNLIKNNTADANGNVGLLLLLNDTSGLAGNTVDGNGSDGIFVENSTNCTISGNTVLNNTGDGIEVNAGSSDNQITTNTALGNGIASGGFDLVDAAGLATQNTWTLNKANTRSSANLG